MKKKNILSWLILIGFAILGYFFLKGHTHEFTKILEVEFKYIVILSLLIIFQSFLRGQKLKLIMEIYNIKLKFKEWWGLEIMTDVGNSVLPFKGGLPAKAVYFKKKYGLSYVSFVSGTGISYLIDFLGFGLIGILAGFFLQVQNEVKYSVLIFFGLIFLCSSFVLFFLPVPIKLNIKMLEHVVKSVNDLQVARKNYWPIFKMFWNFLVRHAFTIARLYFGFLAFGFSIPIYTCIIMGILVGVSKLISITPMQLGFRESIIILSAKMFEVNDILGVLVATLDRALSVIISLLVAPLISYVLVKDFKIKR